MWKIWANLNGDGKNVANDESKTKWTKYCNIQHKVHEKMRRANMKRQSFDRTGNSYTVPKERRLWIQVYLQIWWWNRIITTAIMTAIFYRTLTVRRGLRCTINREWLWDFQDYAIKDRASTVLAPWLFPLGKLLTSHSSPALIKRSSQHHAREPSLETECNLNRPQALRTTS